MKLAIFDVDGTLVDSSAMITASMAEAFAEVGLPRPGRKRTLSIVGLSLFDAIKALAPEADEGLRNRLAEAYRRANWDNRGRGAHAEDLYPGARELLQKLHQRSDVILGLATGKGRRGVDHLLSVHGFEGWFATIQTADRHPSKPHPSMVQAALAETGLGAEAAVMIGDTSFDIAMARAAGVGAAGVAWGNHPVAELRRAGAHTISNDFNELERHLQSLWQEHTT